MPSAFCEKVLIISMGGGKSITGYFIVSDSNNPYSNIALEKELMRVCAQDELIVYLWQNDNTVVIGRNQDAWQECRVDVMKEDGVLLARRLSGGGAVFHDMGNQNFSFIAHESIYSVEKQTEVILQAAKYCGIQAQQSGRNDVTADGQKFSGNAFCMEKNVRCHHGTVLISSDMKRLGEYLSPSKLKLRSKGVQSVVSRVCNLADKAEDLTPEVFREAMLKAAETVYGAVLQPFPQDRLSGGHIAENKSFLSDEGWIYGKNFPYKVNIAGKLSFGEVTFKLDAEKGKIKNIKVFTDDLDTTWVAEIEGLLLNKRLSLDTFCTAFEQSKELAKNKKPELKALLVKAYSEG